MRERQEQSRVHRHYNGGEGPPGSSERNGIYNCSNSASAKFSVAKSSYASSIRVDEIASDGDDAVNGHPTMVERRDVQLGSC